MPLFLVFAACAFASGFALRLADQMVRPVATYFAVSPATAAMLNTAYALPYAIAPPFLGPLGDRLGKRRCIQVCVAGLTLMLAAGAFATSFRLRARDAHLRRHLRERPDPARPRRARRRLRDHGAAGDDRPHALCHHRRADARLGGLGPRQCRFRLAQLARHRRGDRRRSCSHRLDRHAGDRLARRRAGLRIVRRALRPRLRQSEGAVALRLGAFRRRPLLRPVPRHGRACPGDDGAWIAGRLDRDRGSSSAPSASAACSMRRACAGCCVSSACPACA